MFKYLQQKFYIVIEIILKDNFLNFDLSFLLIYSFMVWIYIVLYQIFLNDVIKIGYYIISCGCVFEVY